MKEDDPAAHAFMSELSLDEEQLNSLEAVINDNRGEDPTKGLKVWLEDNRGIVQPWVDDAKAAA